MVKRQIRVGDRIKDNDKRMGNRRLTVLELTETHAIAKPDYWHLTTRIRLDRIHTDGKPRRTGFSLLEPANEQ